MNRIICPFCGSSRIDPYEIDNDLWAVVCDQCGANGPHAKTEGAALAKWNAAGLRAGQGHSSDT